MKVKPRQVEAFDALVRGDPKLNVLLVEPRRSSDAILAHVAIDAVRTWMNDGGCKNLVYVGPNRRSCTHFLFNVYMLLKPEDVTFLDVAKNTKIIIGRGDQTFSIYSERLETTLDADLYILDNVICPNLRDAHIFVALEPNTYEQLCASLHVQPDSFATRPRSHWALTSLKFKWAMCPHIAPTPHNGLSVSCYSALTKIPAKGRIGEMLELLAELLWNEDNGGPCGNESENA